MSGLRPPSPMRYRLDRSASLTGTRARLAARLLKSAISALGTWRLTGSCSPPCGGIRSGITLSPDYSLAGRGDEVNIGTAMPTGERRVVRCQGFSYSIEGIWEPDDRLATSESRRTP